MKVKRRWRTDETVATNVKTGNRIMPWKFTIAVLGLLIIVARPAAAHDGEPHADGQAAPDQSAVVPTPGGADGAAGGAVRRPSATAFDPAAEDAKARKYFTDTEVIDQNGRKLRFYTDVLRGKTVLISMFYTSCTDACPLVNQMLAQVQDELGDRVGDDIVLISISVDPDTDTPDVIAKYAERFEPRDNGWYFLTGAPDGVREIIRRLGHKGEIQAHTSLLVMGNVPEHAWQRARPNLPPENLATRLLRLAEGGFRESGG